MLAKFSHYTVVATLPSYRFILNGTRLSLLSSPQYLLKLLREFCCLYAVLRAVC